MTSGGFDGSRFREQVTRTCGQLTEACATVALATLPARFTAPGASLIVHWSSLATVNEVLRSVVSDHGAVLVELEDALAGPWSVAGRHEHPTSLGQLEVAHLAAAALDATGFTFRRHLPSVDGLTPTPDEERTSWPKPGLVRWVRAAGRRS
jgi:hypothetical protein